MPASSWKPCSTGVGYLLKDNVTDAGTLMDSLARVADGETVIDPTIVRRLLQRNRKPSKIDALNERERAVLRHMAEGRSNLGIAKELFLSARTVETHVTSIFIKLGSIRQTPITTASGRCSPISAPRTLEPELRVKGRRRGCRPPHAGSLLLRPRSFKDDHVLSPEGRGQILAETTCGESRDDFTMSLRPAVGGGRESSRSRTRTWTRSRCVSRETDAAVAHGMVFRASRIVITTSATPRVSIGCELGGGGPSPLTASEPDAIAAECPLRCSR